ncbi:MAG: response regulator [Candidatus Omnitrophota bacterium]|nr:MAG: response regulator [Candidatus Omnitrophota bacterium]
MKKKVLVVDDEKEITDFLERFLMRFDISVIKANEGKQAFDFYHLHNPDFIFLDIQMPGKDGITVLKELREIDDSLKVIMITGRDDKEFREKAQQLGAIDYITKPLDLSELSKKVEEYIL